MMDRDHNRFSEFPKDTNKKIQMSPEEMAFFKECNRDAFVKRIMPFGSVCAAGAYYALKVGFLKPNPTYGYIPAIGIAGIIGCVTGSISYKAMCIQKVLELPNGTLKQQIVASKKTYERTQAIPRGLNLPEESHIQPESRITSGLQLETYQPSNDFDGFTGVNTDGDQPSQFNLLEPLDKFGGAPTTYDDLRRKNREDYVLSQSNRSPPPPANNTRLGQPQAPIFEGTQSFDRDRVPQYQLVD